MPPNTIYCGRPGLLGNPMTLANAVEAGFLQGPDDPRAGQFLTDCFRDWLTGAGGRGGRDWWSGPESDARLAAIRQRLPTLRGYNLACWCSLCAAHVGAGRHLGTVCAACTPCHTDVLLELANR